MYRRDSVELRRGIGVLLAVLRIAAFAGLLLAYLDLQKWSEQQEIQNSRVLVVPDTSISMALNDVEIRRRRTHAGAGHDQQPTGAVRFRRRSDDRIGQVVSEFTRGHLLNDLRQKHDVTVWRFDQHLSRVATLPKRTEHRPSRPKPTKPLKPPEASGVEWLRLAAYGGLRAAWR